MPSRNRNKTSKKFLDVFLSIEWKKLESIFVVCGIFFGAGIHIGNFKSNVENNDKIYMLQNEIIEIKESYYTRIVEKEESLLDSIRRLKEDNHLLKIELLNKK